MADDFKALVAAQKETSRLLQEQIRQNMTADERAESDRIAEEKRQKASEAATRGWQTRQENAAAKADAAGGSAAAEDEKNTTTTNNKQNKYLKGILDFSKKSFKTAKDGIKSGLPSFKSILIGGLAAAALAFLNSPYLKTFVKIIKEDIIPGLAWVIDNVLKPVAGYIGKGLKFALESFKKFFKIFDDKDGFMAGLKKFIKDDPGKALTVAIASVAALIFGFVKLFKAGGIFKVLTAPIKLLGKGIAGGAKKLLGMGGKKSIVESAVGGGAPATAARGRPTGGGGGRITRVAQGIQKMGVAAGKGIGGFIGGILKGIAGGLASIAAPPVLIGLAAVSAAILAVSAAIRIMTPAFEPIGKMMKSFGASVREVFGGLGDFVKDIGKTIEGIITSLGKSIGEVVDKISKMSTAGTDATTKQIKELSKIPAKGMLEAAKGIDAMKKALNDFGGGTTSKVLGSLFGSDGPIDKIVELTKKVPELMKAAEAISVLGAAGSNFAMADAEMKRRKRVSELKKDIAGGTGLTNFSLDDEKAELASLESQAMNMQVSGGAGVGSGLGKIEKLVQEIVRMKKADANKSVGGVTNIANNTVNGESKTAMVPGPVQMKNNGMSAAVANSK
jgi:hypothetical protein